VENETEILYQISKGDKIAFKLNISNLLSKLTILVKQILPSVIFLNTTLLNYLTRLID